MEQSKKFNPLIRCSQVIAECELQFALPRGSLRTKRKTQRLARIRHIAVYLCRKITGRSYPQIALATGYKDHTTALYACRVVHLVLADPVMAAKAQAVEDHFNA